jgi:hypothetical protein
MRRLNVFERLFVYGCFGVAMEVAYTSLWHIYLYRTLHMHGNSHAWAFLIYAAGIFAIERMSMMPTIRRQHVVVRGLLYTTSTLAIEFVSGAILKHFNIVPWRYDLW